MGQIIELYSSQFSFGYATTETLRVFSTLSLRKRLEKSNSLFNEWHQQLFPTSQYDSLYKLSVSGK